jgi:hypothetical protein
MLVEQARSLLQRAADVDEVKGIRDQISALRYYARARGAAHDDVRLAGVALAWADRRLGELTARMPKAPAGRKPAQEEIGPINGPISSKADSLKVAKISKQQASRCEKLAAMPEEKFMRMAEARGKRGAIATEKVTHVANNTGEIEWYTPARIIEAARKAMGGIDLDPASCEAANLVVKAKQYYSAEDDGLVQPWLGRVWLNPPYASGVVDAFAKKLIEELPHIQNACVLVNNATDTAWCQSLLRMASAICLIAGRVKFTDSQGNPGGAPLQGQLLIYFGPSEVAFLSAVEDLGTCFKATIP